MVRMASDAADAAEMLRGLMAPERAQEILRLLEQRGKISVVALASLCGASHVTIRQDLDRLVQQGLVIRLRGAAVAASQAVGELDFEVRLQRQRAQKQAIARTAAGMIDDGEVVALDASTSAYYLALELKSRAELVLVTNSLRVAAALLDSPQITVILTGGVFRRAARSLVGDVGQGVLGRTRIGKGFFSGSGLHPIGGLMDIHPDEVLLKKAIVARCAETIALADHSKWSRAGLLSFARPQQLTAIITDQQAPEAAVAAWRSRGVQVIRA
jgi:DeoR/GlpR family transcriptional regulator of sugar metabolism